MKGEGVPPVALLAMYDWPEIRPATDRLWRLIADGLDRLGITAPDRLSRDLPLDQALATDSLLFGQTCGYPYLKAQRDRAALLATPCYAVDGCSGPNYCSFLVARAEDRGRGLGDFAGRRAIINGVGSQSGWSAFRHAVSALPDRPQGPFFSAVVTSGGHRASLDLLAAGRGDLCAVDAVGWSLYQRLEPERGAGLATIGRTPPTPALPFITARRHAGIVDQLRRAVTEAAELARTDPVAAPLRLQGAVVLTAADYQPILDMENAALARGYPDLV